MEPLRDGREISTILRHDRKQNTYKIALVRAINDVVTGFPDLAAEGGDVAVPLRALAARWVAYYWPFADPAAPVWQGVRTTVASDVTFRPQLQALRAEWEAANGPASPSDGFFLVDAMRVPRRRERLSPDLGRLFDAAVRRIAGTIGQNPVRYAGAGEYGTFGRPQRFDALAGRAVPIPGTAPGDVCVVVRADLWAGFDALSLWVEALCIHEWSLFTERANAPGDPRADRGAAFRLLTARPDNRVALTWERNQINVLLMEGAVFTCPWTARPLTERSGYHLDHLLPLAVHPVNDLWNLVPTNPKANSDKSDKLPSPDKLTAALPHIAGAYTRYLGADALRPVLRDGARLRFSDARLQADDAATFAPALARAAGRFIEHIAATRNVARF